MAIVWMQRDCTREVTLRVDMTVYTLHKYIHTYTHLHIHTIFNLSAQCTQYITTTRRKMSDESLVQLIPCDQDGPQPFIQITRKAAAQSDLMKSMLMDDDDPDEIPEIPLLEVDHKTLTMVVAFLNHHQTDPMKEITKPIQTSDLVALTSEWDAKLVDLPQEDLFKLITAANYLDIPSLLDLAICKVACIVKGKTPEEVKAIFNIANDLTPEEEKLVRDQNSWIFDVDPPNVQVQPVNENPV